MVRVCGGCRITDGGGAGECLLDCMEGYTTNMESLVDGMTDDYFNEKKKGRAFVFVFLLLDLVFFGNFNI